MGFWFSTGLRSSLRDLKVHVVDEAGDLAVAVAMKPLSSPSQYGVWVGQTDPVLTADTRYLYKILVDGKDWMPPGLDAKDLTFTTLPDSKTSKAPFEFLLVSCHGIEAFEKEPKNAGKSAWAMWSKLETLLRAKPRCRVGILGGDQVYMDDTFGEDLGRFHLKEVATAPDKIYSAYFKYWSHPSYRKVMARLPCLLMWDDHDLIDGWGSREEAHARRSKDKWATYGALQTKAFSEMQACRNPALLSQASRFTFSWEWRDLAFLGLDLRSERSIDDSRHMGRLLSDDHKAAVAEYMASLSKKGIKTLFLISPVTVARMNSRIEKFLGNLSNALWKLTSRFGYAKPGYRALIWWSVFSVLYFVLYLNTTQTPGLLQASVATLACIPLLLSSWLRKYLPQAARLLTLVIGVIFVLSLSIIVRSFLGVSDFEWFWSTLRTGTIRTFESNLRESIAGVVLAGLAVGLVGSKVPRWRQNIGLLSTFLLLLFSWWRGLPGFKFDLELFHALFIYVPFGLFAFLAFLFALFEKLGVIELVAGLDDDLKDAWSSQENAREYEWLMSQIMKASRDSGLRCVVLTGDIHTGGLSEVSIESNEKEPIRVPQITSSPVSYVPMEPIVEKLTSGQGVIPMQAIPGAMTSAVNLFYRSERNFVFAAVSSGEQPRLDIEFYFEDLVEPIRLRAI